MAQIRIRPFSAQSRLASATRDQADAPIAIPSDGARLNIRQPCHQELIILVLSSVAEIHARLATHNAAGS